MNNSTVKELLRVHHCNTLKNDTSEIQYYFQSRLKIHLSERTLRIKYIVNTFVLSSRFDTVTYNI